MGENGGQRWNMWKMEAHWCGKKVQSSLVSREGKNFATHTNTTINVVFRFSVLRGTECTLLTCAFIKPLEEQKQAYP